MDGPDTASPIDSGTFRLADDLGSLSRILPCNAPEAVAFYAGRILEATATRAVAAAIGEIPGNAFAALLRLQEVGLLPDAQAAVFHTLRRLGNDARHLHRRLTDDDVRVGVALLRRLLAWYFIAFPLGPRSDRAPTVDARVDDVSTLLEEVLVAVERADVERLDELWGEGEGFARSPVPAALYAELLTSLDAQRHPEALAVLDASLARFPDDWRLRQLRAHTLRLVGRGDEGIAVLEELVREAPDDPETLGLLGGALKRAWNADRDGKRGREALRRSAETYRRAWVRSKRSDTYTGINAATMSALVGDPGAAREIAARILALFERRRGRMAPGNALAFTGYWDRATLAEALLIAGRTAESAALYADAMSRYAERQTWIDSSLLQLSLLLPALGIAIDPRAFVCSTPPAEGGPMYVPRPIDTSDVVLDERLQELAELLAENAHDVWAARRLSEGWTLGPARDDAAKEHPCLVEYARLPESEKEYDRAAVSESLKAIVKLGWRITR